MGHHTAFSNNQNDSPKRTWMQNEDVLAYDVRGLTDQNCLVSRPHYSAWPKRFGSRGPIENVRRFLPVHLGYVTKMN